MADNTIVSAAVGVGATLVLREISHSGDTALLPGSFLMGISGSEGSYTVGAIGGDATNGLDVDVTRVSGNVAVTGTFWQATQPISVASVPSHDVTNAGTFATQITGDALTALQLIDNAVSGAGFNITQFAGATVPIGAGVEATALRVTIATDSTGVVSIDDNGGSITVDGSVSVSGSVAVTGTFWQATQPVSLASVPSHDVTNSGTFVVQATLAAETTKVIGTVNIAAAQSIAATQSGTWTVQPGNTVNTTAWLVTDKPVTSGGLSVSSFLSTAAVQSTAVKASAGMVYAIEFFNIGATPMYVRLYNQTSAPAGGDNANIVWRGVIPGNTAGAGFVKTWDKGLEFSTGIGMRCTGAIADTDTTALAANTVIGNIDYK